MFNFLIIIALVGVFLFVVEKFKKIQSELVSLKKEIILLRSKVKNPNAKSAEVTSNKVVETHQEVQPINLSLNAEFKEETDLEENVNPNVNPKVKTTQETKIDVKDKLGQARALAANNDGPRLRTSVELNTNEQNTAPKRGRKTQAQSAFSLTEFLTNFFTKGNTVVKIGGVVLFIGISFLLKYASENSSVPIEMRLGLVALGSWILMVIGLKLRNREGNYGLILQGISVAIFYAVVFAAGRIYDSLSIEVTFITLTLTSLLLAFLAVKQDAFALAIAATLGAFAVPILCSNNQGNHILLFGYYAGINLGVFAIAYNKPWRILNLIGFFSTFGVATVWGALKYKPELFGSTEPFLILFFSIYLAISILYAANKNFKLNGVVDGTLVFGLPIIAFPLQCQLIGNFEYGVALSSFFMGNVYLILWYFLGKKSKLKLLAESFLALGVVFYTMAIPFAFNSEITSALWAFESAAIIWVSIRQHRNYSRYFALLLQLVACGVYLKEIGNPRGEIPFFNTVVIGHAIVLASLFYSAYSHFKNSILVKSQGIAKFFYLSFIIYAMYIGFVEASYSKFIGSNLMLIYMSIFGFGLGWISRRIGWHFVATSLRYFLWPGLVIMLGFVPELPDYHPLGELGFIALSLFFGVNYYNLHHLKAHYKSPQKVHRMGAWILAILFCREFYYLADLLFNSKDLAFAFCYLPFLILPLCFSTDHFFNNSILKDFKAEYQTQTTRIFLIMIIFMVVLGFVEDGAIGGFYIPFLTPLEIVQWAGILILFYSIQMSEKHQNYEIKSNSKLFLVVLSLMMITLQWARFIHHYMDVNYAINPLTKSSVFQSGISIIWTVVGMLLMSIAKKKMKRKVWMVGAVILGFVVVKLFLIDLSKVTTVARIISFIGVGGLLLAIGYFSPLPPLNQTDENKGDNENKGEN